MLAPNPHPGVWHCGSAAACWPPTPILACCPCMQAATGHGAVGSHVCGLCGVHEARRAVEAARWAARGRLGSLQRGMLVTGGRWGAGKGTDWLPAGDDTPAPLPSPRHQRVSLSPQGSPWQAVQLAHPLLPFPEVPPPPCAPSLATHPQAPAGTSPTTCCWATPTPCTPMAPSMLSGVAWFSA
jgi:hypothetical protein